MEDLSHWFPEAKLTTEEIRYRILQILKTDNEEAFCYRCFGLITIKPEAKQICTTCYRVYCLSCCHRYFKDVEHVREIDTNKCIQCVETRKYPIY